MVAIKVREPEGYRDIPRSCIFYREPPCRP